MRILICSKFSILKLKLIDEIDEIDRWNRFSISVTAWQRRMFFVAGEFDSLNRRHSQIVNHQLFPQRIPAKLRWPPSKSNWFYYQLRQTINSHINLYSHIFSFTFRFLFWFWSPLDQKNQLTVNFPTKQLFKRASKHFDAKGSKKTSKRIRNEFRSKTD